MSAISRTEMRALRSPSFSAWNSRLARLVDITARVTPSLPSSIRLASEISPSRVKSETRPISRRYIRTGSSVRPMGPGVRSIDSPGSACAVSSRSSRESSISLSGRGALAVSTTSMSMAPNISMMSSSWYEEMRSPGNASLSSS